MGLEEPRRTLLFAASSSISTALSLMHRALMDQADWKPTNKLRMIDERLRLLFEDLGKLMDEEGGLAPAADPNEFVRPAPTLDPPFMAVAQVREHMIQHGCGIMEAKRHLAEQRKDPSNA